MNRRETWYLWIALLVIAVFVYFLEFAPNHPSANANQTPTVAPVWSLTAGTVLSVRFEDIKNSKFVELENSASAGKWVLADYALVTPTATPENTATASATLPAGVTPSTTPTATSTMTATNTVPPTATLVASLTPTFTSIPPTKEADASVWSAELAELQLLSPDQNLGDNLQPKDFGLDSPNYRLTVKTTDGKTSILVIGSSAPVKAAGYYAQIPGSKTIYLISASLIDSLIGYLATPPVVRTDTPTATNTLIPTNTPMPTSTPTLTAVAPTDTPAASATAS